MTIQLAQINAALKQSYEEILDGALGPVDKEFKKLFTPIKKTPGKVIVDAVMLTKEHAFKINSGNEKITFGPSIDTTFASCEIQTVSRYHNSEIVLEAILRASNGNMIGQADLLTRVMQNNLESHEMYRLLNWMYGRENIGVVSSTTATSITLTNATGLSHFWFNLIGAKIDIFNAAGSTKRGTATVQNYVLNADNTAVVTIDALPAGTVATDEVFPLDVRLANGTFVEPQGVISTCKTPAGTAIYNLRDGSGNLVNNTTYRPKNITSASIGATVNKDWFADLARYAYGCGIVEGKVLVSPIQFSKLSKEADNFLQIGEKEAVKYGKRTVSITNGPASLEIISTPYIKNTDALVFAPKTLHVIGAYDVQAGFPSHSKTESNSIFTIADNSNFLRFISYSDQVAYLRNMNKIIYVNSMPV